MQEYTDIQYVCLDILEEIIRVCETLDIRYYLVEGSCLGAVRHQGFIPWDDDIDIAIHADDYERFVNEGNKIIADGYQIRGAFDPKNETEFAEMATRVLDMSRKIELGVYGKKEIAHPWVDVFMIYGVPSDKQKAVSHSQKIWTLMRLYKLLNTEYIHTGKQRSSAEKAIITLSQRLHLGKVIRPSKVQQMIRKLLYQYPIDKDGYVLMFPSEYRLKELVPYSVYGDGKMVSYCGTEVRIPKRYHAYLKRLYGDYMTPPPVEERVGKHEITLISDDAAETNTNTSSRMNTSGETGSASEANKASNPLPKSLDPFAQIDLHDIQKRCMEMLADIDDYCRKHDIHYYLGGGTLLGAVRHQGFIPWDDDVDLMMPRKDYNKLIAGFKGHDCAIISCETDPEYVTSYARVYDTNTVLTWGLNQDKDIGIFIDVFPIDGFPTSDRLTKLHLYHVKLVQTMLHARIRKKFKPGEKYIPVKKVLRNLVFLPANYLARRLNKIAQIYSYDKMEYVGTKATTDHLFLEKNPRTIFSETVYFPFGDLSLPAPSGYDEYLRHLYGDYMQLPPEEDRNPRHEFIVRYKTDEEKARTRRGR